MMSFHESPCRRRQRASCVTGAAPATLMPKAIRHSAHLIAAMLEVTLFTCYCYKSVLLRAFAISHELRAMLRCRIAADAITFHAFMKPLLL